MTARSFPSLILNDIPGCIIETRSEVNLIIHTSKVLELIESLSTMICIDTYKYDSNNFAANMHCISNICITVCVLSKNKLFYLMNESYNHAAVCSGVRSNPFGTEMRVLR